MALKINIDEKMIKIVPKMRWDKKGLSFFGFTFLGTSALEEDGSVYSKTGVFSVTAGLSVTASRFCSAKLGMF